MYSGNYRFRTRSNALYIVNVEKKTVTGGIYQATVKNYEKIESSLQGGPLVIQMIDGTKLQTSPIVSYS